MYVLCPISSARNEAATAAIAAKSAATAAIKNAPEDAAAAASAKATKDANTQRARLERTAAKAVASRTGRDDAVKMRCVNLM